jgi:hypothetical protein
MRAYHVKTEAGPHAHRMLPLIGSPGNAIAANCSTVKRRVGSLSKAAINLRCTMPGPRLIGTPSLFLWLSYFCKIRDKYDVSHLFEFSLQFFDHTPKFPNFMSQI